MKTYVYFKETGEITRVTAGMPPDTSSAQSWIEAAAGETPVNCYVEAGTLVRKLPQPTQHHAFSYTAKAWEFDSTGAWQEVRQERNRRLAASDWTQLPDVPMETKSAWAAYRQALRDVTSQADPLNIVWPQVPG